MIERELSIGDLAEAAGVSRRTVRFYVQQRLLTPPLGRGRGRHYDGSHLQRLRRINELQAAGHSLDAIRRILEGGTEPPAPATPSNRRSRASLSAELWTRLRVGEGIEIHYDAGRHSPTVEQLLALRDAVRDTFRDGSRGDDDNEVSSDEEVRDEG